MKLVKSVPELRELLISAPNKAKKIGFVPTMGALHAGHMSLIHEAKKHNEIVVSSVFVNPAQFNNAQDLETYPRTIEKDTKLLLEAGCDVLFVPTIEEVYPKDLIAPKVNLNDLDSKMEGRFRPGHFNGVVQVVHRLFDIVKPTNAYFGLKDFQQVAVIKYMVKSCNLSIKIHACDTLRETSGLAMSSRNMRLSEKDKQDALIIYKTLTWLKNFSKQLSPLELQNQAEAKFKTGNLQLEYLEIIDPLTLNKLEKKWLSGAVCCIAAQCGAVRLIDNMEIN